jgi:hypothetical protein
MNDIYDFLVKTDALRFTYTCRLCGGSHDGGSTVDAGLFDRMRLHLREVDAVPDTKELAPTRPVDESNGHVGVHFVRQPVGHRPTV